MYTFFYGKGIDPLMLATELVSCPLDSFLLVQMADSTPLNQPRSVYVILLLSLVVMLPGTGRDILFIFCELHKAYFTLSIQVTSYTYRQHAYIKDQTSACT